MTKFPIYIWDLKFPDQINKNLTSTSTRQCLATLLSMKSSSPPECKSLPIARQAVGPVLIDSTATGASLVGGKLLCRANRLDINLKQPRLPATLLTESGTTLTS